MSIYSAVSLDDLDEKLLTLDDACERLVATEPMVERIFPVAEGMTFEFGDDWANAPDDSPTSVYLTTPGGERFQLTKQAALEAGAHPGIPRGYQQKLAPNLLADQLNWWYRYGLAPGATEHEFKVLAHVRPAHDVAQPDGSLLHVPEQEPLALAMCRGTVQPFSNLALLDQVLRGIYLRYSGGPETATDAQVYSWASENVRVDYKFHHDLERTNLRLIVPGQSRVITGTRVEGDDTWCTGIQLANSLIGLSHPGTRLDGYLFRYWCTNGNTDTMASTGKLKRRTVSSPEDAYEWARRSVDEILGNLEGTFDRIQQLTEVPVAGDVNLVLADLFSQYGIPVRERNRIVAQMADLGGELSLYDVQNAITAAANADDVSPRTVERLLALGGHTAHAAHDRCHGQLETGCHRLIPEGWAIPASTTHVTDPDADAAATAAALLES